MNFSQNIKKERKIKRFADLVSDLYQEKAVSRCRQAHPGCTGSAVAPQSIIPAIACSRREYTQNVPEAVRDLKMVDFTYPVSCPLTGKEIEEYTCFSIHMVVSGSSPKSEAPEEIYNYMDYEDICYSCRYHRYD